MRGQVQVVISAVRINVAKEFRARFILVPTNPKADYIARAVKRRQFRDPLSGVCAKLPDRVEDPE